MPRWTSIISRTAKTAPRLSVSLSSCCLAEGAPGLSARVHLGCRPRLDSFRRTSLVLWRRNLSLGSIPTFLVPPTVFVGLLISLWAYKCLMMVLFQNKIIYMPSIPPFSRSEKISDYSTACSPVTWEEKRITSLDGTPVSLCIGKIPSFQSEISSSKHVTVLYFQGFVFMLIGE